MDWRQLWTILTGLEPPLNYLPAGISSIILFIIIFLTCFIMHRLSGVFLPKDLQIYGCDFFKTMSFCTYPFGLMILRKHHGDIWYAACNIPLNTMTAIILDRGEGSPVGNWLSYIRGSQSLFKCISRGFVQIYSGLTAYRFGKLLMTLDLHPDFGENLSQTDCSAVLNVTVSIGLLIEILGTTWDVWFHSQHFSDNIVVDKFLKFCNSSLTFCLGGYPTGMFRDPAKAIGLTFGCKGIHVRDHILVYSIGPMVGSFIAHKNSAANDIAHKSSAANDIAHKCSSANDIAHKSSVANDIAHKSSAANDIAHKSSAANDIAHKSSSANDIAHKCSAANDIAHKSSVADDITNPFIFHTYYELPSNLEDIPEWDGIDVSQQSYSTISSRNRKTKKNRKIKKKTSLNE